MIFNTEMKLMKFMMKLYILNFILSIYLDEVWKKDETFKKRILTYRTKEIKYSINEQKIKVLANIDK